jgi:hypothetical protein
MVFPLKFEFFYLSAGFKRQFKQLEGKADSKQVTDIVRVNATNN